MTPEVCTVEFAVTSGTDYYVFADSNDYSALPMDAVNGPYTLTPTMI